MNKKLKKHGISLFELLMAISILSVLLATGYLNFAGSVKDQQARRSAQSIGYAIKKAKYFSRTKGVETSFNFLQGSNTYSVNADGQEITSQSNYGALSGTLPNGIIIITNACPDFRFNMEGMLTDSDGEIIYNDCTIAVGYANGPQVTVLIRGRTGNVEYR